MMSLKIQILTFLLSILYGFFFGVTLELNERFVRFKKPFYNIIMTFFFVFLHVILYFLLLRVINEGILHPYGFLALIIGFISEYFVKYFTWPKVVRHRKK